MKTYAELDQARKADALLRIAFEQSDNIYFRESWWKALPEEDRTKLHLKIKSGTPAAPKMSDGLVDYGSDFISANVVETTST